MCMCRLQFTASTSVLKLNDSEKKNLLFNFVHKKEGTEINDSPSATTQTKLKKESHCKQSLAQCVTHCEQYSNESDTVMDKDIKSLGNLNILAIFTTQLKTEVSCYFMFLLR